MKKYDWTHFSYVLQEEEAVQGKVARRTLKTAVKCLEWTEFCMAGL
jgi:hypothetical protein